MADSTFAVGIVSAGFSASTGLKIKSPFHDEPQMDGHACPIHRVFRGGVKWIDDSLFGSWFFGGSAERVREFSPCVFENITRGDYRPSHEAPDAPGERSAQDAPSVTKLDIKDLFSMTTMMYTPPAEDKDERSISVRIHMLKKNTYVALDIDTSSTIAELRRQAASQLDLSHRRLMLIFNGSQLEDHEEIKSLGMSHGCTIFGKKCSPGEQMGIFELDPSNLDPRYDFDFTNRSSDGKTYWRGGHEYRRPYGWKRYAVKVHGEYNNDTWLGENGIRTESSPREWAVSYHGTAKCNVKPILEDGYKIGPRKLFGPAVYTSPNLEKIDEYGYTKEFTKDGKRYKFALQNRVNPNHLTVIPPEKTGYADFPYWLSPMQDPELGIFHVRPYGILTRELCD